MEIRRLLLPILLCSLLTLLILPSAAQENNQPITLLAQAGFDNYYRPGYWLPIQIQVSNVGASVTGRLTVRPETSGRVVNSAYSTPIDLPTGSEKTAFLYIQVNPAATNVLVELIDNEGVRITERRVGLTSIEAHDSLHMVVSGTGANSIPLNAVAEAGYNARPGRWELSNLPPDVAALQAIDTLIFYDVQTDELTVNQLTAIEAWLLTGGHLIVIGGPSWAQTASGLDDMPFIPFIPTGSQNIDDISTLSRFVGTSDSLDERTFVTTGDMAENASILVESDNGLPLVIRADYGTGLVDYITIDPTLEPLRGWVNLQDFWFTLLSDAPPAPGWQRGFLELQDAARALAILPGINLLPPVTSMLAFIGAYILLIGPVNYFVLSRLRRRAWGWFTIPMFILAFTLLAWNVGFNLRGSEIILSRLYVVQSFSDSEVAYQEQLVGVLSPRRDVYTVSAPEDSFMRVLPGLEDNTVFSANVSRTTAEIVQGTAFVVEDIAIDGGIFANFGISGLTSAPAITGSVTLGYLTGEADETGDIAPLGQSILGIVRNDSEVTLEDVVILARNRFYRLSEPLAPGDVVNFNTNDFQLITESLTNLTPNPSPLMSVAALELGIGQRNSFAINESLVTSRVILGIPWSTDTLERDDLLFEETDDEESNRRRALLRSFMRDQYAGSGIGNQIYVVGWTNETHADDVLVSDSTYRPVDTTLHIIELNTTLELPPASTLVTLTPDQFTWATLDIAPGQVLGSIGDFTLINPGFVEMQIAPIEGAILSEVTDMSLSIDRRSSYGREVEVSLWNWEAQEWDLLQNNSRESYNIDNHTAYLGTNNQVRLRLSLDRELATTAASARIRDIRVFMTGNF